MPVERLASPLLIQSLGLGEVRFFASPLYAASRTPDMPWHSADDLRRALGLPDDLDERFRRRMRADWDGDIRTVATSDGVTTIAPREMGEAIFAALVRRRKLVAPPLLRIARGRFRAGTTAAMELMVGHLPPMGKLAFALSALGHN